MIWMSFLTNPAVIRAALIVAAVLGVFGFGYSKGAASVQADWDQEKLVTEKAYNALREEQAKATDALVTEYEKKLDELRGNTTTIIKKVPVYVPKNSCPMPAGFRVLHDAAARNEIPGTPRGLDGTP